MCKRPFNDAEAVTSLSKHGDTNGKPTKKRKIKEQGAEPGTEPRGAPELEPTLEIGAVQSRISREDRRELKRLKKLKREQLANLLKEKGIEATAEYEDEKRDVNNVVANASRKTEKARLKAARKLEKNQARNEIKLSATNSKPIKFKDTKYKPSIKSKTTPAAQSSYREDPSLTALPRSEIDAFLTSNFIKITDPTSSSTLRPIINFSHLPKTTSDISPFTNFKSPTPIQSAAWPFLLSGRDVVGVAETGSGKTLAFGVPCIRTITALTPQRSSQSAIKAVIVSPTRELAVQIHNQISQLTLAAGIQSVCIYGGVPKDAQRFALRTAHIIVATPGRLNDFISEGSADLSAVTYLVLDEADRMLDKGFEPEVRKILACIPSTGVRQTLMFTATWPPSVRELAASFMRDPVHISIGKDNPDGALRANTSITQLVEVIAPFDKEQRLLQLIKQYQSGPHAGDRILVFCLYKKEATRVEGYLKSRGLRARAIHGDLSQERRSASLEAFKNGESPLLVATDVAARGLDIPAVKLVLNMTFPLTVEDYVHRIGR